MLTEVLEAASAEPGAAGPVPTPTASDETEVAKLDEDEVKRLLSDELAALSSADWMQE